MYKFEELVRRGAHKHEVISEIDRGHNCIMDAVKISASGLVDYLTRVYKNRESAIFDLLE